MSSFSLSRAKSFDEIEQRPLIARKLSSKSLDISVEGNNALNFHQLVLIEDSVLESALARDSTGRTIRMKFMALWGVVSVALATSCLYLFYDYSIAQSFFIATTTITTIGYGAKHDPNSMEEHIFLSAFFLSFVLPFTFLQLITFTDDTAKFGQAMKQEIEEQSRRTGSTPNSVFTRVLLTTAVVAIVGILLLLTLGTLCYRFISKEEEWWEGLFYAITSATTIGYGSIGVKNDFGYFLVGFYAIACNFVMTQIFAKLAALWIVIADNIQTSKMADSRSSSRRQVVSEDVIDDIFV